MTYELIIFLIKVAGRDLVSYVHPVLNSRVEKYYPLQEIAKKVWASALRVRTVKINLAFSIRFHLVLLFISICLKGIGIYRFKCKDGYY